MKDRLVYNKPEGSWVWTWFIYIIVWKLVCSVGLLICWKLCERASERESGVASLGLVPAKSSSSSSGGYSCHQNFARLAFESTQTNRIIERLFGFIYCSWKCLGLHWVWRERVRIESMDSWVLSQRNAILSRVCLECGAIKFRLCQWTKNLRILLAMQNFQVCEVYLNGGGSTSKEFCSFKARRLP